MIENNYFTIPLKEHNFNVYTYLILQMKKMDKHNEIDKMSARRSIIELKETNLLFFKLLIYSNLYSILGNSTMNCFILL